MPSWSSVTRAISAFRGSSWLFQEENGSVRSRTTSLAIPGFDLLSSRKKIDGLPMVSFVFGTRHCNTPWAHAWSPVWGTGNKGRSSQGHTQKGTPPCSPLQGDSQPKWNSFWGWWVEPTSLESHQRVRIYRKQTGLQIKLRPNLYGM